MESIKIRNPNLNFTFVGDKNKLSSLISAFPNLYNSDIVHTNEIVSSNAKPSVALRSGKNSSMALSINQVKSGLCDAVVSAGNTGALMAMCKIFLRPIDGIYQGQLLQLISLQLRVKVVC